jgi:hypothetical protein
VNRDVAPAYAPQHRRESCRTVPCCENKTTRESERAFAWHLVQNGDGSIWHRNPVFFAGVLARGRNSLELLLQIDLPPSGAAHLFGPARGQDGKLNSAGGGASTFEQLRHVVTHFALWHCGEIRYRANLARVSQQS